MNVYFEADYFTKFKCKCGECRHSCCGGWQIDISQAEFFRLIGMDCSEELHRRIEGAMASPEYPTPDCYRVISPNWLGHCPMQGQDGLCMLQKECGEGALPAVCRLYPRSRRKTGAYCHACCSGSCEAVVELLMQEETLSFRLAEDSEAPALREEADSEYPAVSLECMAMLQNRAEPMENRLRRIGKRLGAGEDEILSGEMLNKLLPELEKFSPRLRECLSAGQSRAAPISDRTLENVLANHMLYMSFPYVDERLSRAKAMPGLWAVYHLLKYAGEDADNIAAVFHLCEHTAMYYNVNVLRLKQRS